MSNKVGNQLSALSPEMEAALQQRNREALEAMTQPAHPMAPTNDINQQFNQQPPQSAVSDEDLQKAFAPLAAKYK